MKYHCPTCKSVDLRVVVETWATLHQTQNGDDVDLETDVCDSLAHEWGENSSMECVDCGHCAISEEFDTSEPEPEREPDPGSNDANCAHQWSSGHDEDTGRQIRIYCLKCGADGDA